MLVSAFLEKVAYSLFGLDDDAPTVGDDTATYWLDVLNRKKAELYEDVTKRWSTAFKLANPLENGTVATTGTTDLVGTGTYFMDYQIGDKITVSGETERTIATITSDTALTVSVAFSNTASGNTYSKKTIIKTGVETYSLHRSFIAPSDEIYILDPTGQKHYYAFTQPADRDRYNREVFISDENPQTITFTSDIASTESIVGGELVVPAYYMPEDVSEATDQIPLPDPNWGVAAVAAELAFSDITYEDKAEGLNSKATYLYSLMSKKNKRGTYKNPRTTPYSVKRIRDTRR